METKYNTRIGAEGGGKVNGDKDDTEERNTAWSFAPFSPQRRRWRNPGLFFFYI